MPDRAEVQVVKLGHDRVWSPADGVQMSGVFGSGAMLSRVALEPDALVALHSHPHEQIGFVVSGTLILEIAGELYRLTPSDAFAIPGGVEHSARGGQEGCLVVDVFQPIREDYRAAMQAVAGDDPAPADG